ncbi:MAG: 3-oxoacyl-(acyl-carrier-protein) synthase KASIII [Bacteroidetes bacterium]|nr:MAG: 3-oxoacyl-(acyl-carrier-protein) synthase KASIII [Bacteroidota bacterium]
MAYLNYTNVGIRGLAAAVPVKVIKNYEYTRYFPAEDVKQVVDKIGIIERRFTDDKTCSSDLCYAAAEKLLSDLSVPRDEIDLLIFVSQTPDYRMPATSILLQERLKLGHQTIAFDINLGCSGFIYGMSVIYAMMERSGLRRALLLDGETRSKVYSPKDRKTAFIFGDAGVAALIERDDSFGQSFFSMNSDGSKENLIKMDAGGYRNMSSLETLKEKVVDEHGNIRSDEHGYMNGGDVFNFVIKEIPSDIKNIMQYAGADNTAIDYFVFHQANDFINTYLAKKLKLDLSKVPSTIAKFGNTSSVSIPLTIVSELQGKLESRKLLLSGFGVGMTWASAVINTGNMFISDLVEI